ncbi:MAG: hypothetical protein QG635_2018 [Bacteroidota bacterium]|nr:hypothetical protein [Bacteroidota bacterium]
MSTFDKIIEDYELVSLPSITTNLLNMLKSDDINLTEVTQLVQADPSLTTKLFRVANSPVYATRQQIKTMQQAIMIMGFRKLINIVLAISIFSNFWLKTKPGLSKLIEKFWIHSICTSAITKSIAAKIHVNFRDYDFIGGVLHEIGKLIMIQSNYDKYQKVIDAIEKYIVPDTTAENKIFGYTHNEIGERLAVLWKMPEELISIIANYNNPKAENDNQLLTASVGFASIISEIHGCSFFKGLNMNIDISEYDSWHILCNNIEGIKDIGPELFIGSVKNEMKESLEFLNALKS